MSQLQKVIERVQRGEGPRIGFGTLTREKPRAMALGALCQDGDSAKAAIEAGADFVVFRAQDTRGAVEAIKATGEVKAPLGAWLSEVRADDADALAEAGADFVASPLEGTGAEAVDTERLGHILAVTNDLEEGLLRSLGPLGLDGMFVKRPDGEMTLQQQVEMTRLSALSGMSLLVSTPADISTGALRVLRDSGTVAVVAAEGAAPDDIKGLNERLRSIPVRRSRGRQGETPFIPSVRQEEEHEHDHED